jgi:hypothetical protein
MRQSESSAGTRAGTDSRCHVPQGLHGLLTWRWGTSSGRTGLSGLFPIATTGSQFSGIAALFYARTLHATDAGLTLASASHTLGTPPSTLALNTAIREMRHQRSTLDSFTTRTTAQDIKLNEFLTGLLSVNTSLGQISALVADAVANPGNAAVNQAAIDNLVSSIQTQTQSLRALQDRPTFVFRDLDAKVSDLSLAVASGEHLDADGFTIDINVTQAATRAVLTNFISNLASASATTQFTITGPGGTSSVIDITPTGAQIDDAITGVSASNTATVTFTLTGSVGAVSMSIAGVAPGQIVDAISGLDATLNTGSAVLRFGSNLQAPSAATQVTIAGGGQATLADAITAISPTGNTGDTTFLLSGILSTLQSLPAESITISGGTAASVAGAVTVNPTLNSGSTTIRVQGLSGTQDVVVSGGTQATKASALTNFLGASATGSTTFSLTGALGTSSVTILGPSGPVTTALITPNSGGNFVLTSTVGFRLSLAGSAATTPSHDGSKNFSIAAGTYTQAQMIAAVQAVIDGGGNPLKTRVTAIAVGTGVGFTTPLDTGPGVTLTYDNVTDANATPVLQPAQPTFTGTNGDDATAAAARVNAVSGTTGVYAVVNGTAVDFFAGTSAASKYFGSSSVITLGSVTGGNEATVATGTFLGTAGDSLATVVTNINAVQGSTGVLATADSASTLALSSLVKGSSAFVTISTVSGGTAASTLGTTASGTAGDSQATIIGKINAVTANTGVEAFANGANISLRSAVFGGVSLFGSQAFVTVASASGGTAATINTGTANGTDGDSRATVIAAINALSGGTLVTASAGSTANSITLTGGTSGATEDVQIVATSPATAYLGIGTVLQNTTVFGTDADDRAAAITRINAQTVNTGVVASAGSTATSITLASTGVGGGALVQVTNIVDPLPGTQTEFSSTLVDVGFTPTQAAVIAAINAAANSVGVEAIAGTDVSLRTFLYGSGASISVNVIADAGGLISGTTAGSGTDAMATISVDSGAPKTITASVNEFNFTVDGVTGRFSVPADQTFNPAVITAEELTSNLLPTNDERSRLLPRFNFGSLDESFLGNNVSGALNLSTLGAFGTTGVTVPKGGIKEIDVVNNPSAATLIIAQAITDVGTDISTIQNLTDYLLSPLITGGQTRVTNAADPIQSLEDLDTALAAAELAAAETSVSNVSSLLAQIALLYPNATFPLLN